MTPGVFFAALLALLLSPGPTNTLLAIGGATQGLRRALPLVGAELGGYLLVITPLAAIGGPILAGHPEVAVAVRMVAAAWVLMLAVRLWRMPQAAGDGLVSGTQVFVTTLLNPKALVIGLALLPPVGFPALLPWLGAFAITVLCVGATWVCAGALLGRATAGQVPPLLRRGAAAYLGVVAIGLAAGAF